MADTGNSTAIVFGTSGFTAELLSVDLGALTRESVRTTHLGTATAETFIPADIYDAGELSVTIAHDPDTQPPFTASAETITITWPLPAGQTTAATTAFSGFVTSYTSRASINERMEADVTIKITGSVTYVASA